MIPVTINIQFILENRGQLFYLFRRKYLVERVEYPGDRSFGDQLCSYYSIANFRAYESEFCIWVDHIDNEGINYIISSKKYCFFLKKYLHAHYPGYSIFNSAFRKASASCCASAAAFSSYLGLLGLANA